MLAFGANSPLLKSWDNKTPRLSICFLLKHRTWISGYQTSTLPDRWNLNWACWAPGRNPPARWRRGRRRPPWSPHRPQAGYQSSCMNIQFTWGTVLFPGAIREGDQNRECIPCSESDIITRHIVEAAKRRPGEHTSDAAGKQVLPSWAEAITCYLWGRVLV